MAEEPVLSFESGMVLIHKAITRGLEISIQRGTGMAQAGYPDDATQAAFALYEKALIAVVRGHHMSEDSVAFPRLRDRLADVPFEDLMADHRVMDGLLDEFEQALEGTAAEEQAGASLDALVRVATALAELWHPHIQIEEQRIYVREIIAAVMDAGENAQVAQELGDYAREHVQPLSLGLPFILYNLSSQDRQQYEAALPAMVTEQLIPVAWKEEWAPMQPFLLD